MGRCFPIAPTELVMIQPSRHEYLKYSIRICVEQTIGRVLHI
jgi:hypothetical protein